MYDRDERIRNTREYQLENPGGYDPYGSPFQPHRSRPYRSRSMRRDDDFARDDHDYGSQDSDRGGWRAVESRAGDGESQHDPYRHKRSRAPRRNRDIAQDGAPTPFGAVPDWDYGRGHRGQNHGAENADEIANWFGNERANRHSQAGHRGRGPSGYTRSDERIREDVCDRLTNDWVVDASDVSVTVDAGEVTLSGQVLDRQSKRRAEDCIYDISGVGHVQNNIRIKQMSAISVGLSDY